MRHKWYWFLIIIVFGYSSAVDGEEWAGWRGGVREGLDELANPPTEWSTDKKVLWKSAILGRGYSSPVVSGDKVFLTSAYSNQRSRSLIGIADYTLCFFTAAAFFLFVTLFVNQPNSMSNKMGIQLVTRPYLTVKFLIFLLVVTMVQFSKPIFGYEKSANRAWIASVVVCTVCAVACLSQTSARSVWRIPISIFLLCVFFGGVSHWVPGSELGRYPSLSDQVFHLWLLVNSAPLMLIGWIVRSWLVSGRERPASVRMRSALNDRSIIVQYWPLVLLLGGAVFVFVARPVWDPEALNQSLNDVACASPANTSFTLVSGYWIAFGVVLQCLLMMRWWHIDWASWKWKMISAISACNLLLLGVEALEWLTRHSPFLSSRFGTIRLEPVLGWPSLCVIIGCGNLALILHNLSKGAGSIWQINGSSGKLVRRGVGGGNRSG